MSDSTSPKLTWKALEIEEDMSFNDLDSNYFSLSVEETSDYINCVNLIKKNLETLEKNISNIKSFINKINKRKSKNIKENTTKMTNLLSESQSLLKKTFIYIKQLPSLADYAKNMEKSEKKMLNSKLINTCYNIGNILSEVSNKALDLVKNNKNEEIEERLENHSNNETDNIIDNVTIESHSNNLLTQKESILSIEKDMNLISEMFKDMSIMIQDQDEMIDNIENNIITSNEHSKDALLQLKKANEYQNQRRNKMCYCLLFFVILLLIIVLIIAKR